MESEIVFPASSLLQCCAEVHLGKLLGGARLRSFQEYAAPASSLCSAQENQAGWRGSTARVVAQAQHVSCPPPPEVLLPQNQDGKLQQVQGSV